MGKHMVWSLVVGALTLGACGSRSNTVDDPFAARPCASVDAGPTDLGTADLGGADLGRADLGVMDLGLRDLGAPDLGPPDLGAPDLGPPDLGAVDDAGSPVSVDVVGVWHGCSTRYAFGADGRFVVASLQRACEFTGVYRVSTQLLSMEIDGGTCVPAPSASLEYEVLRGAGGLVLVPSVGSMIRLADDATPRVTWNVERDDGRPGQTTLRVVDPTRGPYSSGCYWSTDGACGGIFSCGGSVLTWRVTDTAFVGTTSCDGPCPCVALSTGTAGPGGVVTATFDATNCLGRSRGSFTATPTDG